MTAACLRQLPHPPMLTRFPFTFLLRQLPGDVRSTPAQRQSYLEATRIGDPAADGLVAMFQRLPAGQGRALFELAVEQGIAAVEDPPPELTAFFASVDAVPYWVDPQQLALAARVIGRSGVVGNISLSMGALLGGYLAHRVVKCLVGGDLDQMAPRRVAETMLWFVQATAPGGLDRFAPGFRSTLRVRLMHAMVRAGMGRRSDWDWEAWDRPVNGGQILGTQVFFAVAQIAGSQALGMHWSRDEKEAVYAFFRYVGYLLGAPAGQIPASERDYWRLFWLQVSYELSDPDEDSVKMAQALIGAVGPVVIGNQDDLTHRIGRHAATGFLCGYARLILGKPNSDFLGLPDSKAAQAVVVAAAATITCLEVARRVIPGATRLSEVYGRRVKVRSVLRMMHRHHGDQRFSRADQLSEVHGGAPMNSPVAPPSDLAPHPPTSPSNPHRTVSMEPS
ncbi:oxygenase MpaB family protein [Nocardia sp. NPDC003963]